MPLTIKWEDGRIFAIDRLVDGRQAPSFKGGNQIVRLCQACISN
jgi:hypothetical protein